MKNLIWRILLIGIICLNCSCKEKGTNQPEKVSEQETLPIMLSNSQTKASCVYLTADENDRAWISWIEIDSVGQKHFYFSKYDEEVGKFKGKQEIPIDQNASIHEEGMPKLAVKSDGSIFALFETSTPVEGSRWGLGDVRFTQSFDGGKTWTDSKSVVPEDIKEGKSAGFSNLTRLADGEIGIAWLSTASAAENEGYVGRPVKFAKTLTDRGVGPAKIIDPHGCECCRTALAVSSDNGIFVAYRNLLPGSIRDISMVSKTNGSADFSTPVSFSNDHWKVDGCPHNGPALTFANNKVYTTWYTNAAKHEGVNFAELNKSGKVLQEFNLSSSGQFADVGISSDSLPIVAYSETYKEDDQFYNRIMLTKFDNGQLYESEVTPEQTKANFPMVWGLPQQKAVIAWRSDDGIFYKIASTQNLPLVMKNITDLSMN